MSELIEQLAKEHSSSHHIDETRRNDCHDFFEFTPSGLEAFAKAYQAAAPIDNVAEALEKAANICDAKAKKHEDRLADESDESECSILKSTAWQFSVAAREIRALIPDTQANRTEAAREQS
jgi:hypothetical protein